MWLNNHIQRQNNQCCRTNHEQFSSRTFSIIYDRANINVISELFVYLLFYIAQTIKHQFVSPLAIYSTKEGDPSADNAVTECEDVYENNDQAPNNDSYFTGNNFIQFRHERNDTTRHQRVYKELWDKIKSL